MNESDVANLLSSDDGHDDHPAPVPPLAVKLLAWAVLASLAFIPMAGAYFAPIVLRLDRDCPALTAAVADTEKHLGQLRTDTESGLRKLADTIAQYPRPAELDGCAKRLAGIEAELLGIRALQQQFKSDFDVIHPRQRLPQGPYAR